MPSQMNTSLRLHTESFVYATIDLGPVSVFVNEKKRKETTTEDIKTNAGTPRLGKNTNSSPRNKPNQNKKFGHYYYLAFGTVKGYLSLVTKAKKRLEVHRVSPT